MAERGANQAGTQLSGNPAIQLTGHTPSHFWRYINYLYWQVEGAASFALWQVTPKMGLVNCCCSMSGGPKATG